MITTNTRFLCLATLTITVVLAVPLAAQVQTEVPPVVPGAKPVTVEHVKVHGTALEGNLEGVGTGSTLSCMFTPSRVTFTPPQPRLASPSPLRDGQVVAIA